MFSGSISSSVIYPREIIKRVLALRATAVIIAHNHPSGNTEPSCEDKSITAKVAVALQSVDVQLHDHIIVGDGFHSMADTGWLKKEIKNLYSHPDT
jgi:DNA repair protein RadC